MLKAKSHAITTNSLAILIVSSSRDPFNVCDVVSVHDHDDHDDDD